MKPVHTAHSNFVYVGGPGIGDLHAEREEPGVIASVWALTAAERAAIAAGANLRLVVMQEPVPPCALEVTDEQGIGEDAPAVLERLDQLVHA